MGFLEGQTDLFQNEQLGVFPHRLPDHSIQLAPLQIQVSGLAVQAEVLEDHVHILGDALQLHLQGGGILLLGLEQEIHGRNGRLDLMHPEGVVGGCRLSWREAVGFPGEAAGPTAGSPPQWRWWCPEGTLPP